MKLLIVDDEFLFREEIIVRLKKKNYQFEQIYCAENGREALTLINEFHPDIVITDIRMEFMNGIDLLKICRREGITSSFIITSGYAEFEYAQAALENGTCGYLLKPIDQAKFFKAVDNAINQVQERDFLARTLHENTQLLINNLISKCKQNTISPEDYDQLLKLLNTDRNSQFIAASVHLSIYSKEHYPDSNEVYHAFKQALTEQFSVPFMMLPDSKPQNRLILFYDKNLTKQELIIQEKLNSLLQKQKVLDTIMTIGLSRTESIINADLFLSSQQSLCQRFEHGIGNVYADSPWESESIPQIFDISSFELRIKNKTGDEAAAEFEKLIDQLYPHMYNLNFLFQYLYELLIRTDFRPDPEFWIKYIESKYWAACSNPEEALAPIRQELKRACRIPADKQNALHEQIKDYLYLHYSEDLTLSYLSDKYHLTPKYFSAAFKKNEGISLVDYLTQIRIEKAKNLLCSVDLPASEIASLVGYEDPRYFYKVFKKMTGITPKKYRQQFYQASSPDETDSK